MPPIDFGDTVAGALNRVPRLFDTPRGWGTAVRRILSDMRGVFGSVANRDAGTMAGEVPEVGADGTLGGVVGAATADARGLSTMAALVTPAELNAPTGQFAVLFSTLIGASRLAVRHMSYRSVRVVKNLHGIFALGASDEPSLVLISARGRDADTRGFRRTIHSVDLMSDSNDDADTVHVHLNSGHTPDSVYRNLEGTAADDSNDSAQFLTQAQCAAFGFVWGIRLRAAGSAAGTHFAISENSPFVLSAPPLELDRIAHGGGDLLIAYKRGRGRIFMDFDASTNSTGPTQPIIAYSTSQEKDIGGGGYALELLL